MNDLKTLLPHSRAGTSTAVGQWLNICVYKELLCSGQIDKSKCTSLDMPGYATLHTRSATFSWRHNYVTVIVVDICVWRT